MKEGNHPFIISYKINYALSNSIYSIDFKGKDTIHIDELFKPLISLESPIFINPARSSCSLIKAEENLFEIEEKPLFRSQNLRIAPPKREFEISEQKEIQKLQSSVAGMSLQLEKLNRKI
jgi:hypothetical protein